MDIIGCHFFSELLQMLVFPSYEARFFQDSATLPVVLHRSVFLFFFFFFSSRAINFIVFTSFTSHTTTPPSIHPATPSNLPVITALIPVRANMRLLLGVISTFKPDSRWTCSKGCTERPLNLTSKHKQANRRQR